MPDAEYAVFKALDPFFEIVQKGGRCAFVDGEHYFDTIADDALRCGRTCRISTGDKFDCLVVQDR